VKRGRTNVKGFPACPIYPSDKSGMKMATLKLCIGWENNFKAVGLVLLNFKSGLPHVKGQ